MEPTVGAGGLPTNHEPDGRWVAVLELGPQAATKGNRMSAIEEILGKLPVDQLAAELGTDQDSVTQAASAAIESAWWTA